jgi:hypothetical protein
MKIRFMVLFLLGISIVFTNCNKDDEDQDLTVEITGEYSGAYGNNSVALINPYEVVVTKVDNNHVTVKPKTGSEFDAFEVGLEKTEEFTISSTNDPQIEVVIFNLGPPVAISMSVDPTGDAHNFEGIKQ